MYRVMIVDDETYFREYLRLTIPWQCYDFEICAEAADGEEGLFKIPISNPDIILVDINMPIMNGISFSYEVKERYPYISIILITAYNEFEYAKQALKIGVENYISKPFEKQELIDGMISLKKNIINRKEKEAIVNDLQKKYIKTFPVMKNNILNNAVKGIYANKYNELIQELKVLKVRMPNLPFLVAIIYLDIPFECNAQNQGELRKDIISVVGTILNDEYVSFEDDSNRIIIIKSINGKDKYKQFVISCSEIINNVYNNFNVTITIGTGTICEVMADIRLSFEKACIALRNKFLLGNSKVIEYYSFEFEASGKEIFPFKFKNDLMMFTRLLDGDMVMQTLDSIYSFLRLKPIPIDYIYILYTELMSLCFSYLAEYGYNTEKVFGQNFYPFEEIINKQTLKDTHEYVTHIYGKLIACLNDKKNIHSAKIINKAKEYIDSNYQRSELTIEDIAASVFFHPSYLRFLFKKETGITIGEYLTQVRMLKAKELLKNCNMRHTEVANMLGYSDASYFSKCFKKYNKISPSEYERLINQKI
jgi:two-component system, response regulator YesN